MYFPVSDIVVNPSFPPLIAFVVSFFCSMGGISGAFLLLPYQVSFLGITTPGVSATNHFFNVIATPSGLFRYFQEKRFLWPLTCIIIAGTLPGLVIGTFLRLTVFMDAGRFKFFVGLVLLYIGIRLAINLRRGKAGAQSFKGPLSKKQLSKGQLLAGTKDKKAVAVLHWNRKEFAFSYDNQVYTCATLKLVILSTIVGIIGGIYGVGGGAIIAPFLVAIFKLPVHVIGGSTLMATFLTSLWGSILFYLLAPLYPALHVSPDWKLGLLLGIGGILGIYCGARCQKYVSGRIIGIGLAIITISAGLQYIFPL